MQNEMIAYVEETLANAHDTIIQKMIVESLLKNGKVTIEEAKFFSDVSKKIITESSDLFIPEAEEIQEIVESTLEEAEAKLLVDPETGDQYLYDPTTGELTPAETEEPDADDMGEEEPDLGDEDVSASEGNVQESEETTKEGVGSVEETTAEEPKKELTENELLVEKLLATVKAL